MGIRGNNKSGRLVFLFGLLVSFVGAGIFCNGTTIATFADPAVDGSTPLFSVDFASGTISGGWDDSQTGLTLEVVYTGQTHTDAFFVMDEISYNVFTGVSSSGTIKFFADGSDTSGTPLIQIDFARGHVSPMGFSAMDLFYADDVTISGSEIETVLLEDEFLEDESFSFAFANHVMTDSGFTATSSFTSSANIIPEPATLCLLSLGFVMIRKRKK